MDHSLLTVEQIAEILRIKPNTIRSKKWQKRTGCPLNRIGKRLYSPSDEFHSWSHKRGDNEEISGY